MRPDSPSLPPHGLSDRARHRLLACGVAAPILALSTTLAAMAAYPGFNPARQYLSELGGATAAHPLIFNAGVFVAGLMAALAGIGFGLALVRLSRARITGALIYPWPDRRHLAINLALGIQLAPLLLLWSLRAAQGVARLKVFLAVVFVAMAVLTVLTKHLVLPSLVNDDNVGWWERGYAVILVGWVGVAAFALNRRLDPRRAAAA